jgi:hypothetical protein
MDFRGARRLIAGDLSGDLAMDTANDASHDPSRTLNHGQSPVHTDGQDPASPGGPAPYNGDEPYGEPAVDDPMWRDPSQDDENKGGPVPHVEGPNEGQTTLHNARLASYMAKAGRHGMKDA